MDANAIELITRAGSGDSAAADSLVPFVYDSLRALARKYLAGEPAGQTLQPTALVNEAYVRIVGDGKNELAWDGRSHFYAAAALAMRRILVDRARRYQRLKHGGGRKRVTLDEREIVTHDNFMDMISLDEALDDLSAIDQRGAEIVMLRYFAGLDVRDTAAALDLSERTVRREWSCARLWLLDHMGGKKDGHAHDDT